ncbi:MAG: tetratricopeptide repeat protein [Oscillatoriaceae bacterium SKW80]|nr:tetratricopeptide repeat protein [Oscillatoriaceae bacterium SKYG93]MCX8121224.1 tetratricopeptide repeat protein [Oscillatoriaceae bacterium SKW80]MDW8453442.1 CheR family methyltransferase [Oscillatoriaceae cyanobacterium SKYGB_i_bin93]HIK26797.1 tetratricopeptide repeat protein [Oscillatoriaceae cyanobacterium M7585_C2015_266]
MNDAIIEQFVKLISDYTGLHIREQEHNALQQKIWIRMRALKLFQPEEYYQILAAVNEPNRLDNYKESEAEWKRLISLLTTGESYFFRDRGQFQVLENHIFKELIARQYSQQLIAKVAMTKSLRIWSAGCSTGEEPYSLAILLQEMIPNWQEWEILIIGTDINQEAIEKAKRGIYSQWSFRMVDPALQKRYFIERYGEWEIKETIRSMVKFRCGNLVQDSFPNKENELENMDLIICRNVFVYFDADAIAKVLEKFYNTLKPGGYLITAHAELHGQNLGKFKTKLFPESIVYQRGEETSNRETNPKASTVTVTSELPSLYSSAISYQKSSGEKTESFLNPFFAEKYLYAIIPSPNIQSCNSLNNTSSLKIFIEPQSSKTVTIEKTDSTSTKTNPDEFDIEEMMREAETLFKQEAYTEAIQKAEQVLAKKPRHFGAHYLIAQAYANLGEYEKAHRACQLAIQIDSLSPEPYYLLAHLAEEQGDIETAKMFFKRIIYLEPASIIAYLELASLYEREGDMLRARKMRSTAIELLSELPADATVDEQYQLQAGELLFYVQKMLGNVK